MYVSIYDEASGLACSAQIPRVLPEALVPLLFAMRDAQGGPAPALAAVVLELAVDAKVRGAARAAVPLRLAVDAKGRAAALAAVGLGLAVDAKGRATALAAVLLLLAVDTKGRAPALAAVVLGLAVRTRGARAVERRAVGAALLGVGVAADDERIHFLRGLCGPPICAL
jgi:hypothetical protein